MSADDLPEGWATATLGELVEPRRVKANPQATPNAKFVGMAHVEAHTTRLLGTTTANTMKSSANAFQRGDVLYGRLNPHLNKVHRPDFDGLCSGEFVVLPENDAVSGAFLKYRLVAHDFLDFASHLNAGDRPRVDFSQLQSFALALPPKTEQDRIANLLDELLGDLANANAALEHCRDKLHRYRASVLKAAVEGDLTADWRTGHPDAEPASVLLQRILADRQAHWEKEQLRTYAERGKAPPKNWKARYKEPVPPGLGDLPSLPRGWCWATVDQCASAIQYGSSAKPGDDSNGIPVLRMGNLSANGDITLEGLKYLPIESSNLADLYLKAGDLLFNRTNSIELVGKTATYVGIPSPATFASYLIRVRLLTGLNPRLLMYMLNSYWGRQWIRRVASQTVGQANVNGTKLSAFAFPLPSEPEQERLVSAVDEQIHAVDSLDAQVIASTAAAAKLRQAALHHAFSGKLVAQDPNDEPASCLLERIAAKRDAESQS